MPARTPKHQLVFESLKSAIVSGRYAPGQRLPSEAALLKLYDCSRITVGRAVRDLQQQGLVQRRAGSGTYVRPAGAKEGGKVFGLLIPELGETEIFEPMCQGLAKAPHHGGHVLLWGNSPDQDPGKEERAWQLCRQFLQRRVDGVFFAPLELSPSSESMNQRILRALDAARIPVVLLDRGALAYPQPADHDLVGIDNRRAGRLITEHLLRLGARRTAFLSYPYSAPTVESRLAGYQDALLAAGLPVDSALVLRFDPAQQLQVRQACDQLGPDAFVCANDRTAAHLMHTLLALGSRIPEQFRITGFDDVAYASLLPVPLTTIRQPCREIGEVAMAAMRERVANPGLPPREILLDCRLVVRRSCGACEVR